MDISNLQRGFDQSEFEMRTQKAQKMMAEHKLDALFITTEAIFRYFTGFHSQFWHSPTRPWFLIVPANGKPVAVVPSIGEYGLRETWVDNIHCWDSPHPTDDGISLLISVMKEYTKQHKRVGVPLGQESFVRMPYNDFQRLQAGLAGVEFVDISLEIHKIRAIKSPAEIEKIKAACQIAIEGFDLLEIQAKRGQTELDIYSNMAMSLLEGGADKVPYLIIGSGQGGYESIIMGPTGRVIEENDVMIIDTGVYFDGYYADFCRNFVFGEADDETFFANERVYNALEKGFKAVRPGVTTTDIYHVMWSALQEGGAEGNNVGRIGHGLGSEITEWPSLTALDNTPLEAGMVITLEPGMDYGEGKSMVHEECILVTDDGAQWISRREKPELITLIS